jgi:hypothetical protein
MRNLRCHSDLLDLVTSSLIRGSRWERSQNWVGWSGTPYGPIHRFPILAVTFNFQDPRRPSLKLCLCSRSRTAKSLPVSPCSFCHIHRECCRHTVPAVADLFPTWFSWIHKQCVFGRQRKQSTPTDYGFQFNNYVYKIIRIPISGQGNLKCCGSI